MTNPGEKAQKIARHHLFQLQDAIDEEGCGEEWINLPLLLAIVWRETRWSETRLYKDHGSPLDPTDDTGDHGHGHGFFQIDDRFHGEFIRSGGAYYPYEAAKYIIRHVLLSGHKYLSTRFSKLDKKWIEIGALASYNCGAGNVRKSIQAHLGDWDTLSDEKKQSIIDYRTARPVRNYTKDVLECKKWWAEWLEKQLGT